MEDDLQKLSPILNAFQKLSNDRSTYEKTLDQVDADFSVLLSEEVEKQRKATNGFVSRAHRAGKNALSLIRPVGTSDELLKLIQRKCELTDKQIRLLRDIGLVILNEKGNPVLRHGEDVVLTQEKAACYLFATGCLLGIAVTWTILEPTPGLWLIVRGIGLGTAIGSIAGFVLGRSYRVYPILEKLKPIEPWLTAQVVAVS